MLLTKNRQALHDHQLLEKYVAGIVLKGYEVKALRENKASFEGAYIKLIDGKPYLVNLYVPPYSKQGKVPVEMDTKRARLLLLKAKEIESISKQLAQKGFTAIPLAIVVEHNLIKVEFGIMKGLKEFEKKHVAKEKQQKRDLARESVAYIGAH